MGGTVHTVTLHALEYAPVHNSRPIYSLQGVYMLHVGLNVAQAYFNLSHTSVLITKP